MIARHSTDRPFCPNWKKLCMTFEKKCTEEAESTVHFSKVMEYTFYHWCVQPHTSTFCNHSHPIWILLWLRKAQKVIDVAYLSCVCTPFEPQSRGNSLFFPIPRAYLRSAQNQIWSGPEWKNFIPQGVWKVLNNLIT